MTWLYLYLLWLPILSDQTDEPTFLADADVFAGHLQRFKLPLWPLA